MDNADSALGEDMDELELMDDSDSVDTLRTLPTRANSENKLMPDRVYIEGRKNRRPRHSSSFSGEAAGEQISLTSLSLEHFHKNIFLFEFFQFK